MHILVVNDDGPPSSKSSPYVHAFVVALQARGHVVSVVLPHEQRSWIGKAHFVHQDVTPSYFRPGTVHEDDGTTHALPLSSSTSLEAAGETPDGEVEEWVLVDGTPATCTQMGLFHFYRERGPVEVVVSGPNFGRNSSALFALSSGTIGGAMEAAACGFRAVAVSFAFSPEGRYLRQPIEAACRLGARLVEHLVANWDAGVELYNVNVPLLGDVESRTILWTYMLENKWRGSCFQDVKPSSVSRESDGSKAESREDDIRKEIEAETAGKKSEVASSDANMHDTSAGAVVKHSRHEHRTFKWHPSFKDVFDSVKNGKEGNDGLAVYHDCIRGPEPPDGLQKLSMGDGSAEFTAYVKYEDSYVQPLIEGALGCVKAKFESSSRPFASQGSPSPFLQISSYEAIDHELLLQRATDFMANSYTIRKALIRKEYLASIVRHWSAKNPDALLSRSFPETISLHLDYAEFLDDALMEGDGMTLMPMFEENTQKSFKDRTWWMVKASMADRGQGIRLFSTFEDLQEVFEEWEGPVEDDEGEEPDAGEENGDGEDRARGEDKEEEADPASGMTSSLRHFVLQRYIAPLLLPQRQGRKFHVRCYVVAVGTLRVYVYREMLALFAAQTYAPPDRAAAELDLAATHLTNTCLQDGSRDGAVERYWDLPDFTNGDGEADGGGDLDSDWKQRCFDDICLATGQLFRAAVASPTDFQPLPNAFELYGVDWLIGYDDDGDGVGNSGGNGSGNGGSDSDARLRAWLLEVNAFPDLKQTGPELSGLIGGLWRGIVRVAVGPFFGVGVQKGYDETDEADGFNDETAAMRLVLEEDMKR